MATAADLAQLKLDIDGMKASADEFFLIVNGMLIYLMQAGFAFLECGAVRSMNATNILIKNVLDSFLGAVAYWLVGFPLAYGTAVPDLSAGVNSTATIGGANAFIGYNFWASSAMPESMYASWFFQFVFAATAATIVSGAMAERCDFFAYMIYSLVITAFVYPVVTHWGWDGAGWLLVGQEVTSGGVTFTANYQDFAGSGIVHLTGGVAALCGAAVLGPRQGRFKDGNKHQFEICGHSVPLAALGGFILFFGFFAFNGGSQLTISNKGDGAAVALSCMNTVMAAAGAAIVLLTVTKIKHKKYSLLLVINGALAGMVSICAGCNVMAPWAALVTGCVAGVAYMFWSWFIPFLKIDDPLDAFAVHAGGGMWGVIATALFDKSDGVFYGFTVQSFYQLAWAFVGIFSIALWSGSISLLMFGVLRATKMLRVDPEIERKGMDIPKHGEPAYPISAYGHGWEDDERENLGATDSLRAIVPIVTVDTKFENAEVAAQKLKE